MRLASGRTTINQENEEERWPAVEWGKEPWLPGTVKQPSMITEAHQQGLEQGQAAIENESKMTEFQTSEEPVADEQAEARALWARATELTRQILGRQAG
jgi:hypothetical protein